MSGVAKPVVAPRCVPESSQSRPIFILTRRERPRPPSRGCTAPSTLRSIIQTVQGLSCQPQKLEFARSLGADAGVNYTQSDWVEQARAATGGAAPDIIYESVGGAVTKASLEALAPLGELVVYGALNIQSFQLGVPELLGLIFKNQSVTGFAVAPLLTPDRVKSGLAELFDLAVCGQLKVTSGGTFPLELVAEAHRALEGRLTTGKIVLVP